jgi:voltage-gated potassium channel
MRKNVLKKFHLGTSLQWDGTLLIAVVFAAFVLPALPMFWQRSLFRIAYTIIYISAVFSLQKRSRYIIWLFVATFVIEWFSSLFHLPVILAVAKGANMIFFLAIVGTLIRQIATAREVTPGVIVDSIVGYLLLGMVFSIFIAIILQHDPAAFANAQTESSPDDSSISISVPLYFGFVTLASLGYGDVVPLKPYARSLATLIAISGQFYMAVIVALLVGKFSAKRNTHEKPE